MSDAPPEPKIEKRPPGSIHTFACPSCGGTVGVRAVGTSITATCQSCGSIIDIANENYRVIRQAALKTRITAIPLGARATLFDEEWEVIGYCARTDRTGAYSWREYLLFNPYQGFRFLVEAEGHWNFVKMLRGQTWDDSEGKIWHDNRPYHIYLRGSAKVEYVMGEFFWRVKLGEQAKVADYICPPYILSMEESDGDIVWSQGIYVPKKDIEEAFGIHSLPPVKGIAPNQPRPNNGKIRRMTFVLLALLIAMQVMFINSAKQENLYHRTLTVPPSAKGQLIIADPIDIPGTIGNIGVWARSHVLNNWVELDISLANDETQDSEDLVLPIEYYFGSDSDGTWSEGSQTSSEILSSVPGGKYHLLVEPDAGIFPANQSIDLELYIIRDVPSWGNFWLAFFLLMAYPLYVMMRTHSFESRRWADSDYAPTMYKNN